MKEIIIYTLSDPQDNLVKYVGITSRPKRRLYEHINYDENNPKSAWIKSLVKKGLNPIFEELERTTLDEFSFLEKYWISQFKSWGFTLKNITDGGEGTYGLIPWNKGKTDLFKHSDESKKKMSEYRKDNTSGEKNGFYGKKHTEDNIKLFSKLSINRESYKRIKNQDKGKEIYCYTIDGEFVKKYKSGVETTKDGFNSNIVSKVCRGINKTHKGHVFSFTEINSFNREDYTKKVHNKGLFGIYKHTQETRNNMSLLRKNKKINIDNSGVKNPNCKKIYCYDINYNLIKEYEYIKLVESDGFNYHVVRKKVKYNTKNIESISLYKNLIFTSIKN